MYTAVLLHNNVRKALGRYNNLHKFEEAFPAADYPQYFVIVIGRLIYVFIKDV